MFLFFQQFPKGMLPVHMGIHQELIQVFSKEFPPGCYFQIFLRSKYVSVILEFFKNFFFRFLNQFLKKYSGNFFKNTFTSFTWNLQKKNPEISSEVFFHKFAKDILHELHQNNLLDLFPAACVCGILQYIRKFFENFCRSFLENISTGCSRNSCREKTSHRHS